MFENLSHRLSKAFKRLSGGGRLKEAHVKELLQEVRKALLEADVALRVVKDFIHHLQKKAIGLLVASHLSSEQTLMKLVHEELVHLMGDAAVPLNLKAPAPLVILMVGLQGAGKTTTAAKLALHLKNIEKKSVGVVSVDIYRPAAIEQLQTLAQTIEVDFIASDPKEDPPSIVKRALTEARKKQHDILMIDTAGRLHVDETMMQEVKMLCELTKPTEVLFVVDSMMGQSALEAARVFGETLPLTGVILSKMDGDARGGAALSVREVTGKPIKFMGVGEKTNALEVFHPERIASRILGMGDLLSLIEQVERQVDKQKAEALNKKLSKGQGFDLNDFRDQLKQMMTMGGLGAMMDKLPGMSNLPANLKAKVNDKDLVRCIAVLDSMTPQERFFPEKVDLSGSRKRRIALGSGTSIQKVNEVLKKHAEMQKNDEKGFFKRRYGKIDARLESAFALWFIRQINF